MHTVSYIGFRFVVGLFKFIPFPLLYRLSDLLRFILKDIIGYRKSVIDQNLAYCFPEKTKAERTLIANAYYKNFVDIILESFKGLAINPGKLIPRYKVRNPEILVDAYKSNEHLITYSQHYNNWEWGPICLGLQTRHHIVGIVKLIANPLINNYMIDGRSGNNVSVVPSRETGKYLQDLHKKSNPQALVFIADQRPSGKERFLELPFLGGVGRFHHGAAIYASKANLAIYSIDVHRIGRGRYEIEFVQLAEKGEGLTPEQITILYKEHLENLILQSPESWLWTHKRFKEYVDYKKK